MAATISLPSNLDTVIWGQDGVATAPSNSKYNEGWEIEPARYDYQNYAMKRIGEAVGHIVESGVAEFNSSITYNKNALCKSVTNSYTYVATQNGVTGGSDPTVDTDNWTRQDIYFSDTVQTFADSKLENVVISDAGLKVLIDAIFPVGTVFVSHGATPPLSGVLGVTWELLSTGYAVETGTLAQAGTTAGSKSLQGNTGSTTLNPEDFEHYHGVGGVLTNTPGVNYGLIEGSWSGGSNTTPLGIYRQGGGIEVGTFQSKNIVTTETKGSGGGSSHHHTMNIKSLKLAFYRRTA